MITVSIYGFAIYVLLTMMFDNENEDNVDDRDERKKKHHKYYGDMTVMHIKLESRIDKLTEHLMLSYLNNKLKPDQVFVNEYGEIYLIFYKAYLNVNRINEIQTTNVLHIFDDGDEIEKRMVKSVSVLGFNDKTSFIGFMSKCSILCCQRFLDNYYSNETMPPNRESLNTDHSESESSTEDDEEPKNISSPFDVSNSRKRTVYEFSDSSESERSMSLENYYIFPHTIKNLVKFSKETNIDVNQYNTMWGTWIKYNEEGEPISFPGFPINEDTMSNVCDFIMSSYKKNRKYLSMNYDHTEWYETYGKICYKPSRCSESCSTSSNTNNISMSDNSTDSESEKYVKL